MSCFKNVKNVTVGPRSLRVWLLNGMLRGLRLCVCDLLVFDHFSFKYFDYIVFFHLSCLTSCELNYELL